MATTKKRRVVKRATTGGVTDTAIVTWFREFAGLRDQIKQLGSRESEIKDRLKDAVEQRGYKDDSGSWWFELPEEIGGFSKLKKEQRVSEHLDREAAMELVRERGLEKRCIKMVPQLDEDALAAVVFEKKHISEKEFQALMVRKVTWAFVPKK